MRTEEHLWWSRGVVCPGACYWMKTFYDDEVPIKSLFTFDMPMPTEKFVELLNPSNQEIRKKWDEAFKDHVILEAYLDNGGHITSSRIASISGIRIVHTLAVRVDWYEKKIVVYHSEKCLVPVKTQGRKWSGEGS